MTELSFETGCQSAANASAREKVALEFLEFLIHQSIDAVVVSEVLAAAEKDLNTKRNVGPFPRKEEMGNVRVARLESRLEEFFDSIHRLVVENNRSGVQLLAEAREICEEVDKWNQDSYWVPLFDFLKKATEEQWRQWRTAVVCHELARRAILSADFGKCKQFSIYGLDVLDNLPDRRLYLDLCSRLENALAEGDSFYCVAVALGKWIVKESVKMSYYLRAVGMQYNLGNQLLMIGRLSEALVVLEEGADLCNDYWYIRAIAEHQRNFSERLMIVYILQGKDQEAKDALGRFEFSSVDNRSKKLQDFGQAKLALAAKDYKTAVEFLKSSLGQGSDFVNDWYAYLSLALCYVGLKNAELASTTIKACLEHAQKKDGFLSVERMGYLLLVLAGVHVLQNKPEEAEKVVEQVNDQIKDYDLPLLEMNILLLTGELNARSKSAKIFRSKSGASSVIEMGVKLGWDVSNRSRFEIELRDSPGSSGNGP